MEQDIVKEKRWRLLQVESAISCNLHCIMCPWKKIRSDLDNSGLLSEKTWEAIRPYLPDIRSIDFSGGGEPLLQPLLLDWIIEAKRADCEVGFLTNGVLLQEDLAKQFILAGVDWICISIDGATADVYQQIRLGSTFDLVCENIGNAVKIRGNNTPKIMINVVLLPMNIHQIEDVVRLAAHLGVDQINFKHCDVSRGEHGKNLGLFASEKNNEIRRLEKELSKARKLAQKLKINTTAFAFTPDEQSVCDQDPRHSLYIRYDGAVAPCINLAFGGQTAFLGQQVTMPTIHFGCLPDNDLMDLWEGKACTLYRKRFQKRVEALDNALLNSLIGVSGANHQKILKAAKKMMPLAPDGCNMCHYLYNI